MNLELMENWLSVEEYQGHCCYTDKRRMNDKVIRNEDCSSILGSPRGHSPRTCAAAYRSEPVRTLCIGCALGDCEEHLDRNGIECTPHHWGLKMLMGNSLWIGMALKICRLPEKMRTVNTRGVTESGMKENKKFTWLGQMRLDPRVESRVPQLISLQRVDQRCADAKQN